MLVLGLSGSFSTEDTDLVPGLVDWFFHDAAACLIRDGELVAAVEEERLNRIKKTTKFPINAIRACLERANVSPSEIDAVGHYFRQDFVDQALNELYVDHTQVPARYSRDFLHERLGGELGILVPDDRIRHIPHHRSHAASCFTRSGMAEALVVVLDGQGEEDSGTVFRAAPGKLERLATYDTSKSLGALYEYAIRLLGYRFGDEYKVMGLAPYGDPETYQSLFDSIYTLGEQGDYRLHPKTLVAHPIAGMFLTEGFVPRRKGERFTQRHKDLAAGLQQLLERIVLHVLSHWAKATGLRKLCFVGGVAHNSSLNGAILRSGLFDEVFVHPASHDAGAAEGAALATAEQLGAPPVRQPRLRTASFGPILGRPDRVAASLRGWEAMIEIERPGDIVERAAGLLADGAVLGWAQGASEFGPRALGNRSILADARPAENKSRINAMVKKREGYRPFAPVATPEAAERYFELPPTRANYDFMSYVVPVRPERRAELGAVTHVDGTARLQIIHSGTNQRFHRLVTRFGQLTGTPVLLNTSFNNHAEPIVQTVNDVVTCFLTTGLDYLVIEDFLVSRRPGSQIALDELRLRFRPVTRLARRSRLVDRQLQVRHEIYLDYVTGPAAEVSPEMFDLLERAAGATGGTVGSLGELTESLRHELFELWEGRFFQLMPPGSDR